MGEKANEEIQRAVVEPTAIVGVPDRPEPRIVADPDLLDRIPLSADREDTITFIMRDD